MSKLDGDTHPGRNAVEEVAESGVITFMTGMELDQ
jgi:hypothetical protein